LRCPAETSPDEAGLFLADRCHSLRSLLPPQAALPSLPLPAYAACGGNNPLVMLFAIEDKKCFCILQHSFTNLSRHRTIPYPKKKKKNKYGATEFFQSHRK